MRGATFEACIEKWFPPHDPLAAKIAFQIPERQARPFRLVTAVTTKAILSFVKHWYTRTIDVTSHRSS